MSILKDIFCREKVRLLPVQIKENDYFVAIENNIKKIYGDKFSQYGYVFKNSIVIYQVGRFAEQDSQTQMAALLFDVSFFAYTIYPPYNTPIDCEIKRKKQSSEDDQITMFQLQPIVLLNETSIKFYDRNPIYISVNVKTTDIDDQEKYKIGDKIKAIIHMGTPWVMKEQCSYACSGTIQGIKTDAYLQKKFENYEQKYIEKKNRLLGQKKKLKNNQKDVEEGQHQEQNMDINLDDIDSESDYSENNNKKNKETTEKKKDQEKTKKKKVRIYTDDDQIQDQESVEEYISEEEEDEQEDGEEEEEEDDDDLNEYELDEEDEDEVDNEKEIEAEQEVE